MGALQGGGVPSLSAPRRSARQPCTLLCLLGFFSLAHSVAAIPKGLQRAHEIYDAPNRPKKNLHGQLFRRILEDSGTSHKGPLLARDVPRLAEKHTQVEQRFTAKWEETHPRNETVYAHDPDIKPSTAH
eukprot:631570-Pyramimonas_sp.AAC.3